VPADFWTHRLPEKFKDVAPRRIKRPTGGEAIVAADGSSYWGATGSYAGHTPATFDPMTAFDFDDAVGSGGPAQRLREQDEDGVGAELLFPGSSAVHGIRVADRDAYLAMVDAYNDYLAEEYCSYAPDRLFGVGMLPSGDLDLKVAQLERFKRIGLRAASLHEFPAGQPYPTPEDDRFWAAALDLEMPLSIHTTMSRGRGPLFKYPKEPEFDRPPDDFIDRVYRHANASRCGALTVCQLIFAGVFDRFPRLRIYWAENQLGWIPFYLEQMDIEYEKNHVWAEHHFGIAPLNRRPSEYVREHAYWGFYDDPVGVKLRHEIGIDHIVWGSDFPHVVTRWPNSQESLDQHMAGVPYEERRKIESDNILEFLGLGR
jgi:predicted TIM-barrel fold metal-dependent hydrolase